MPFIYSVAFFLQALLTPGTHRVDGKHIHRMPSHKNTIAVLDTIVCESSGLVCMPDSINYYLTLNDSGGKPEVFAVSGKGALLQTFPIPSSKNKDWEELTDYKDSAQHHHIVIGDIGNNRNRRTDLCLYDYTVETTHTVKHTFGFEDQHAFPPAEDDLNYDCEAFFRRDSSYYFISKNRSKGPVKVYRLSQDTSDHVAVVVQRLSFKGMVTACSLYKDSVTQEERLAILTYGRLLFFDLKTIGTSILLTPIGIKSFPAAGQTEGVAWVNAKTLLMTNEKGKIFEIVLKK